MKNNQLDNFESLIKSALDKQRVPYDASDWKKLNKKLGPANKPFYSSPWFIAASITLIAATIYLTSVFFYSETTEDLISSEEPKNTKTEIQGKPKNELTTSEKENNKIKEDFINAEKVISENKKEIAEVESKEIEYIIKSETNQSEVKEVVSENSNEQITHEENGYTPLDSEFENNMIVETKDEVTIEKAAFHMSTFECCQGSTIDFVAEKQNDVEYLWSFDDGSYSKNENPSHLFENAGSYKISLIVRSKKDNTIMTRSNDQLLIVHAKPLVNFEWEMNEENGIPYTSFINLVDKANSWSWNFGDGSISNEKDPNHTYRNKGQYLVSLAATNIEGCTSNINKDILINEDYNLLAPNSFTPNGDGLNDYFLPAALNRLNGNFTMTIYSQAEGLVYNTKNIDQPWDGTNQKAGTKCKEGSYVWVVKLTNEKGQTEQYKGAVLLLK